MIESNRYPLVGLHRGVILVLARLYGPARSLDVLVALDTGASLTMIAERVVREIGLDPLRPVAQRPTHVWGGTAELPVLRVARVRVFGQEVADLEIAYGRLSRELGLDGVLGLNFLRHFDLRINFRGGFIELK